MAALGVGVKMLVRRGDGRGGSKARTVTAPCQTQTGMLELFPLAQTNPLHSTTEPLEISVY